MAPLFKTLRELDPSNVNQAVKLRLIRCYTLHVGDDTNDVYSLECVLHDAEGHRIHASIKKASIARFRTILKDEHLFAIKNFLLATNNLNYKTSTAEYKMVFIPKTNVIEVFDADFPRNVFEFKVYDDLSLWENMDENYLIDVIGWLSSRSTKQTREVRGRQTTMLDITLKNLQGSVIPCTLWGDLAEELLNHVETNDGPIVVIMQMFRIKKFRGDVRLSNTFKVLRLIFSENVQEIEDFKRGLILEGNAVIPVTNLFMPSSMPIMEELEMSRGKILTLNRLIRVQEIDHFWVFCQVVAIEPMFNWYFVSCKKCFKKMAQAGPSFYCVNCDFSDPVGILRYKVMVRVADNLGIASFILWDKDCVQLIGKTVAELQATSDGQGVPKAISRIVGLKALFKIDVKDFYIDVNLGPFSVMKMTSDMQLISQFCDINSLSTVDHHEQDDINSISTVDLQEQDDTIMAPVKPIIVKTVPTVVRVGVKRNLMEEFSGNEDEQKAKSAKTEGD